MLWVDDLSPAIGPDMGRLAEWWREVLARWRGIARLVVAGLGEAACAVGA